MCMEANSEFARSSHRLQPFGAWSATNPKSKSSCGWDFLPYPIDADKYRLFEAVGKGATAEVYLAYCEEVDADVAIKMVKLDDRAIDLPSIATEVSIMKRLRHRHVLPLYAAFVEDDQMWMVMPFVSGGSALDIMRRHHNNGWNEHVIATIMKPVLHALAYLHNDGVIHRDLKAGNILIDHKGKVILADMGVTTVLERNHDCSRHKSSSPDSAEACSAYLSRKTFAGTPCWMAPEVMEDHSTYELTADIWSFGITLLELALGQAPLAQFSMDQILMKTVHEDAPVLESSDRRKRFTEDLKDLVSQCLQKDPARRPTARNLLKHPFWKAAYDGKYLVEQLDIGTDAALAGGSSGNVVKGAASLARSNVVKVLRNFTDKTIAEEEVDARDGYKLLHRLTAVREYENPDAEPLPVAKLRMAKGLAVAMLKGHGGAVKFLRGSGFVLGRCRNSRREATWSAPLYFTIDIRNLPRHLAAMEQVHMAIVIPSEDALSLLMEPECSFEPPERPEEQVPPDAEVPAPQQPLKKLKSFLKKRASHISLGLLPLPGTDSTASISKPKFKAPTDGINPSEHSKSRHEEGLPRFGYGIEVGSESLCPLAFDLAGAQLTLDSQQNGRLYGKDTSAEDILQIRRTRRPAAFNRFVRDLDVLVQSGAPAPDDGRDWKTPYYQD